MNRIESEWLHIKEDEIAGKMFEDEYDLALSVALPQAIAVIHAVESRASQKGYKVEGFRFNSQSSTA